MASEVNHLPKSGLVLLAGLTVFWGLNWPGMKIILSEVPVWWFRASCVTFGGCALLTLSMLAGHRWRPLPSEVWPLCRCALFNVVAWHLQWAYFKTVHLFPASIAATGTLLIPVVGVYSSSLLLAEQVGWREFLALLMICAALAFVLRPQVPRRPIRSTTAGP